jgi:hypothetical protein
VRLRRRARRLVSFVDIGLRTGGCAPCVCGAWTGGTAKFEAGDFISRIVVGWIKKFN